MPRKPSTIPAGVRIADKLTVGEIVRVFPRDKVEQVLIETGRETKRIRELPNDVVIYFAVMQGLYRNVSSSEVLRIMAESLHWLFGDTEFSITGKSGISQARSRVGFEPHEILFRECAKPLADHSTIGAYYRQWRLTALDGSLFNVEDTDENANFFKRSKNQSGSSAYPKAKVVSLMEIGTRACFDVAIGTYKDSELTLAEKTIVSLKPDMLCLADRLFMSFDFFVAAARTGAALVWRTKIDRTFTLEDQQAGYTSGGPIKRLPDGSFIATIYSFKDRKKERGIKVRVIEYDAVGSTTGELIRLFTNILDPLAAPAEELAQLYHQRWEIETMLDEVKTHLGVDVIHSRTPKLVKQELYGVFMAHYVTRAVMHAAAKKQKIDPDELSFVHSVRVLRRAIMSFGSFPP
jgi:Insertion element 4 transposase N-terminal/Transposase DDE domain